MSKNYLLSDAIISPIGFGTEENLSSIRKRESALKHHYNSRLKQEFCTGLIDPEKLDYHFQELDEVSVYTKLEKMLILGISKVISQHPELDLEKTGLIIATTKGNIDLLNGSDFPKDRIYLWKLAGVIADFFGFKTKPVVVSNACISGALAIKVANELINIGRFENAIVAAGDLVSDFVLSGFNSFQAISPMPCRPFSKNREGISLGEAAAAILIGPKKTGDRFSVSYMDAVTANDANHISGPSRTGEGLYQCVSRLLDQNKLSASNIDFISAHGTATDYNDEMEAIAFNRAGLENIPVNSFKGYYGHSLGASALIESILTKRSMLDNELFASHNFSAMGTSKSLNIIREHENSNIDLALKTASGFGGCNLAMALKKEAHG